MSTQFNANDGGCLWELQPPTKGRSAKTAEHRLQARLTQWAQTWLANVTVNNRKCVECDNFKSGLRRSESDTDLILF